MIKNILVPHDFSCFANLALEKAMEIASKFKSNLILLTVVGPEINSGIDYGKSQEIHDKLEAKYTVELNKIKESKANEDVAIAVKIIHNPSSTDGILNFVNNNDVDLIVMGSHGRSGFKKLILGSVASGVITKASCSVMIVKQTTP